MNRIREYREKLGISQSRLAVKIGLAQSNLSDFERGTQRLWPKAKRDLCRVLGATEDELFSNDSRPVKPGPSTKTGSIEATLRGKCRKLLGKHYKG